MTLTELAPPLLWLIGYIVRFDTENSLTLLQQTETSSTTLEYEYGL